MKFNSPRKLSILLFTVGCIFCLSFVAYAQPTGATLSNPIQVGTLAAGVPFTSTLSNAPVNNYQNNIGFASDDIYYRFTIATSQMVSISHCGSGFDTHMILLNSSGTTITAEDDFGPLCPTSLEASMKIQLAAGTYYIVSEGSLSNFGSITTEISIPSISETINTTIGTKIETAFQLLEKNRVPHGLLKDYALEQTNLEAYDGVIMADSNRVSSGEFMAIYQTLATSRINTTVAEFEKVESLRAKATALRQPGKVVLEGLFYKYAKFKEDAVTSNKLTIIGTQVDDKYIGSVWQDPYEVKNVFAVAPTGQTYSGKTQQFVLPSTLMKTNSSGLITGFQFDADDGLGYRSILLDQVITVNYLLEGLKEIKLKLLLSGGGFLLTHAIVKIQSSIQETCPQCAISSITATESFEGKFAKGYMSIRYANPSLGMQKPLIVAEGFDMSTVESPENIFGSSNIANSVFDILDNNPNLDANLSTYDIVYIDWRDGVDNIKRNALLLKHVIRQVNTMKATSGSTQKNVVLGQSMGGLVARWALKDMEDNNENHQTRLFISYDTPHQGANVPLAYQYAVRHLGGLYFKTPISDDVYSLIGAGIVEKGTKIFDSPAARQMLINYVNKNYQIDNSVHNTWQTELKTKGYPDGFPGSPLKVIAISNGSECAISQNAAPGTTLLSINGSAYSNFWGDLLSSVALPIIGFLNFEPELFLGLIPGKSTFTFDSKLNAIAGGGGNRVYYTKINYTKKALWLISIGETVTELSKNAPGGTLAFDSYPGGSYDTGFDQTSMENQQGLLRYNISFEHQRLTCFIPVTSALDIGSGNVTLTDEDYKKKYVGSAPLTAPKNSPFANFIAASNANDAPNKIHLALNSREAGWLIQELNGGNGVSTRNFFCPDTKVIGPDAFCNSGVYTLDNIPDGATINWQWSNFLTASPAIGSISTITRNNTNISGDLPVLAEVTTSSGISTTYKMVRVGGPAPYSPMITTGGVTTQLYGTTCLKLNAEYPNFYSGTFTVNDGVSTYVELSMVSKSPANANLQILQQPGNTFVVNLRPVNATATLQLIRTNSCGSRTQTYTFNANGPCVPAPIERGIASNTQLTDDNVVFYPNPANTTLTVGTNNAKSAEGDGSNFDVLLFDARGKAVRSANNGTMGNITLQTGDIPNGTYYLHVKQGTETIKKQVIIKH